MNIWWYDHLQYENQIFDDFHTFLNQLVGYNYLSREFTTHCASKCMDVKPEEIVDGSMFFIHAGNHYGLQRQNWLDLAFELQKCNFYFVSRAPWEFENNPETASNVFYLRNRLSDLTQQFVDLKASGLDNAAALQSILSHPANCEQLVAMYLLSVALRKDPTLDLFEVPEPTWISFRNELQNDFLDLRKLHEFEPDEREKQLDRILHRCKNRLHQHGIKS